MNFPGSCCGAYFPLFFRRKNQGLRSKIDRYHSVIGTGC